VAGVYRTYGAKYRKEDAGSWARHFVCSGTFFAP